MHIKKTADGICRVLISDSELAKLGAAFSELKENDPFTRTVIRRVLALLYSRLELPPGTTVTVEAAPTDGGCLLLITPSVSPAGDTQDVYIFSVPETDAALSLYGICDRLTEQSPLFTSLYETESGYRLLLYGEPSDVTLCRLSEFAYPLSGGSSTAAGIKEHGKLLWAL